MNDEGLRYFTTVTKRTDGQELSRETDNRVLLLAWLAHHYEPGDELTVTIEARGAAALNTVAALRFSLMKQISEQ